MRQLIHRFLEHLASERNLSPHTVRAYEGDLLRLLDFLARDFLARPPEAVRPEDVDGLAVRSFLAALHTQGLERRSQARALSAVRSLLRFACREGTLAANPALGVPTPKLPKTLPRHLRPGEVEALLEAPGRAAGLPEAAGAAAVPAEPAGEKPATGVPAAGVPAAGEQVTGLPAAGMTAAGTSALAALLARRDSALLELLYAAGLRVGELVGLDWGAIDLPARVLRVIGKGGKERMVPFGRPAAGALRQWLDVWERVRALQARPGRAGGTGRTARPASGAREEPVFLNHRGGRLSDRSVRRVIDHWIEQTALARGVHPHTLRHTFATHLLEGG
ncbi:MAG: tyrosine-type recombinase/integrase, partial [Acidobacteria bacterium]|nr:tyrosine-type recombinase/integrase [Acidobacteriota bacterium]